MNIVSQIPPSWGPSELFGAHRRLLVKNARDVYILAVGDFEGRITSLQFVNDLAYTLLPVRSLA